MKLEFLFSLIWWSVSSLKGCKHFYGKHFYNLQTLQSFPPNGDYSVNFTFENQPMKLILNFCSPTYDRCIDGEEDYAHILNTSNMECFHLTSDGNQDGEEASPIDGWQHFLRLQYEPGISDCKYGEGNYQLDLVINCNESREPGNPSVSFDSSSIYSCRPQATVNAVEGCPTKINQPLWDYIESVDILLGIIMIVLGLVSALFGFQLMRFIFFTTGYATIIILVLFFIYEVVLPQSTQTYLGWVIWFCASILGLLFGMLLERYGRVAIGFLGAWLGGVIGITFYAAFLHQLSEPQVVMTVTIIPIAIICIVFSVIKWQRMMVLCTGICGSFFTIRVGYLSFKGLSLIAGNYPNQFRAYQLIRTGQLDSFPWQMYLYLSGMFALAIISISFQIYRKSRDKEENELKRKNYMSI